MTRFFVKIKYTMSITPFKVFLKQVLQKKNQISMILLCDKLISNTYTHISFKNLPRILLE